MLYNKNNNSKKPNTNSTGALKTVRNNVYRQAALAALTIVLTLVILFANIAAWYTNIIQASGLMFEVAPWDFEGNVTVGDAAITAAPGDEGVIPLTVSNDSDNIVAVSVNISKAYMDAEMQKRLYFYVETQQTRDGEIMDRVYLSNTENYTYTLFSQGELNLTESVHNDALLKWHWVYDVLGYYVLGTALADETVTVHEYLKPIEYDYDLATTVIKTDEEGNQTRVISTVDGETSVEDFLVELSKTDGYAGEIDVTQKTSTGYYPVEVDETGYGVWAYICTYSEVETGIVYDTELGKAAAAGESDTYTARLGISAQKSDVQIVSADTLANLQTALTEGYGDLVQLTSDITIPGGSSLNVESMEQAAIDLNGYTLYCEESGAINAASGSQLIMYNGTLQGPGSGTVITAWGSEVTLNHVTITGADYPLEILDDTDETGTDSKVRLVNCQLEAEDIAVYVRGNNSASAQMTQIIIEDCTILSKSIGIQGNGGQGGTDIQVINSVVDGDAAAIFHPQPNSSLTISGGSAISGGTGILWKGGSLTIIDSTVSADGAQAAPSFDGSGCTETGDAVYIETNYGHDISLEVYGNSTLSSVNGYSIQVYESTAEQVEIALYGGTYNMDVTAYLAPGATMSQSGADYVVTAPVQ